MPSLRQCLVRGILKLCPHCGKAPLFESWGELYENCPACGSVIRAREPDTWFFMYMSIAATTGLFIILMFLIRPQNETLGRVLIGVGSLALYYFTHPPRKGLAIAIEYWMDSRSEHPRFPSPKA